MKLFLQWALYALFAGTTLTVLPSCDDDDEEEDVTYTLSGTASGAAERPNPVTTTASGELSGNYNADTKVLTYTIAWSGLSAPPSAMHFHGPAGVNEVASPVVGITVPAGAGSTGTVSGTATLTTLQESQLLAGQWYYNLHTSNHPGGEIRAQVITTL
jgi:hypothetical protein